MPTERGSNGATTSINQSGGITSSATSVTVAASTSAGFPNLTATPGQFRVQVEQELWLVTATAGTDGVNWTITRHIEGTTAAAHVNGSQVVQKLTWAALENLAASGGTPAASAVSFTPAGGIAATDVQAALQEVDTEKAPKASPTFTGVITTPALAVSGLTGSVVGTRYVGATASGAPTTGAHLVGDWSWALDGALWLCTVAGTPGTWVQATGGGTPTSIANGGGTVAINGSGQITATAASGQDVRLFGPTSEAIRIVHGVGAVLNGANNAYVQANNDDTAALGGGPSGAAGIAVSAAGDTSITGGTLKVPSLVTTDPSVADAVWSDGGVLVLSGSTAPSPGAANPVVYQHTCDGTEDTLALPTPAGGVVRRTILAHLEDPSFAAVTFLIDGLQLNTFSTGHASIGVFDFFFPGGPVLMIDQHIEGVGTGGGSTSNAFAHVMSSWNLALVLASDGITPQGYPTDSQVAVIDYA